MNIGIFGDIHGHWRDFRDAVRRIHEKTPLDLVLQCGDAQPFRNEADLSYMHCPRKYREMGDFRTFMAGGEIFPVRTVFIGGNHEPWSLLDEHRDGGEIAPNIEFLGRVASIEVGGIKIAGLSGIYSERCFELPHMLSPYRPERSKQATYYNKEDVEKAKAFHGVDILLLHEWPDLMNKARDNSWPARWAGVGSAHLSSVVEAIRPRFVFCGHMHKAAGLKHDQTEIVCLSDFHRDPANAYVSLDTRNWTCQFPIGYDA